MATSERAGQPADPATLVDVDALLRAYDDIVPDPSDPTQRVAFGTSGHRGSAFRGAFNEAHILAITEAICRYRALKGYDGPLYIGRDTHALSEPATRTALEVLAAHGVHVRVDAADRFTPTPAVSHAIIVANRGRDIRPPRDGATAAGRGLADGIVVTPSHNPPDDGGFKYNPPNGGPADTDVTGWIQDEANRLLEGQGSDGVAGIGRIPYDRARAAASPYDFTGTYVADLTNVVDLGAIRDSGLRIGVDPMGGASVDYWAAIAEHYGLDLTVVNDRVDPTFGFMTYDWDGKIRMDPSSPSAMAGLI
jgi:phosphoglucomutase